MNQPIEPSKQRRSFEEKVHGILAVPVKRQDIEARKKLISASTLIEWLEFGFMAATVTRIADRAGISTATLYRTYPDRDQLNLDALSLGNDVIVEVTGDYPRHPHPFRNLVEMIHHFTQMLLEPIVLQFHLSQQILLRGEPALRNRAIEIASSGDAALMQIWHDEIDRLVDEALLHRRRPHVMLHRIIGGIVARTLGWYGRGTGPYQPPQGWFEEAIKIAQEFCALYGTAKMRPYLASSNWPWLATSFDERKGFDALHPAQFSQRMAKELPFLADLRASLATQGDPGTIDAFIWRELVRLLTKSPNRLDAANRQSRIVAAALLENQQKGFGKMSISAIAKTAGVSTATVYRVFPSDVDLYEACHRLGASFFIAWLSKEIDNLNPVARVATYLELFVTTFMDKNIENTMSMNESILANTEQMIAARTGVLMIENLHFHWQRRLIQLAEEGYLKEAPSWDMVHTMMGPIESGTYGHKLKTGVALAPEGSWFEECWTIVDEFFQIYGTPQFHAMRKKMNWDADLEAYRAKST